MNNGKCVGYQLSRETPRDDGRLFENQGARSHRVLVLDSQRTPEATIGQQFVAHLSKTQEQLRAGGSFFQGPLQTPRLLRVVV